MPSSPSAPSGFRPLGTEEYDSLRKLRVRYAHDVAGRVVARATLLEGAGSAEAVALTAGSPGDAGRNGEAAAWFAGGLPSAPVRYLEKVVYTPGAGLNGAPASMEEAIHESSATRSGQPRVVRIGRDGLGRETYRSRGGLRAAITTYDGVGARLSVVDENGNPTIWRNDSLGRPYEMEDAAQKVANYRWDAASNKTSEQDRRGVTRVLTCDNLGRLKRTAIAPVFTDQPWSETIDYLDATRQVRTTDARGSVTLTTNDGLGRPATITQLATQADGSDRTRSIGYTGGDKSSETDWMGRVTVFGYDGLQRLTTTTDPAPYQAQSVETFYDDAVNRTRVRDRKGNLTVTQFDSLGRVVWVRRGACDVAGTPSETCETVERNEYDASSNKVLSVDGVGNKTRFEYDAANRLVAREEGYEAANATETTVVRFVLDPGGRVREEHRGRLAATKPAVEYRYDALNRVVGEKNGLGEETIYGYDDEGNRTSVRPPSQPATTYGYDELGKLILVTQPATADHGVAQTRFGYDQNRNKVRQEDARENAVAYEYDRANRLMRMVQPLNIETSYAYDPNGGATSVTDPNGQTRTSAFDELGRLRTTTYAENTNAPNQAWRGVRSERFEYDANSNPTEIHRMVASGTDPPVGQAIVRVFDALDRLETETTSLPDGGEKTVRYEYFANGTRRALIDANARRTEYGYDAQNRVKSMTTATDGRTTSYTYYKDDLLHQVINPNGDVATSTYDDAGRIDTLVTANGATTVSSYDYGYDTNGNRTSQIEILAGVAESQSVGNPVEATPETTTYAYDNANRLKRVTYPADATYPQGRVATYTYDKAGNREGERETTISTVPPTTEFPNPEGSVIISRIGAFDANNRLSSLSSSGVSSTIGEDTRLASYAFTYDNNGNEVQRTSTTQHTPDPQGEPRPATVVTTNSTYDLSDRLVEQERGGAIIARHEYDGEGRRTKKIGEEGIRQYVYDDTSILAEYDTNGLEIAKYDYGADRLIRLTRTDEGTRYFSFDGLGSVTSLTTLSGTVAASYRLDAWGQFRFEAELAPSKNRFGYTGHYWDKESSLYYAKARYYDPFTARFTQSDSFLGNIDDPPSLHRYFYASANPTMFVDPSGYQSRRPDRVTTAEGYSIAVPQDGEYVEVHADPIKQLDWDVASGLRTRGEAFAAAMDVRSEATKRLIAIGAAPSASIPLLLGGKAAAIGYILMAGSDVAHQTAIEGRSLSEVDYLRAHYGGAGGAAVAPLLGMSLSSQVASLAHSTRLALYGLSASAVGSGAGHVAEGVLTGDYGRLSYGVSEIALGGTGLAGLRQLQLPRLEMPRRLQGVQNLLESTPYLRTLEWSTDASMFLNPARAVGLRPPTRSSVNRGDGGHALVDRLAGEAQGAIAQASRILKAGSGHTRWAQLYQALRGSGSRFEFLAERNALHQEAERLMLGNRYVLEALESGNQLVFNRGSIFGIRGRRGGLTRPDVQIGLPDGRWAILDWTTPGSGAKILKYQHPQTPFLINIFH